MEAVRIVQEHWLLAGTFVCFFWPALLIFSPVYIPPLLLYTVYARYKSGKTGKAIQLSGGGHSSDAHDIASKKPAAAPQARMASIVHGSIPPSAHPDSTGTDGGDIKEHTPISQDNPLEQGEVASGPVIDSLNHENREALKQTAEVNPVERKSEEKGHVEKSAATETAQPVTQEKAAAAVVITPVHNAGRKLAVEDLASRGVRTVPVNTPSSVTTVAALQSAAEAVSTEKQPAGATFVVTPISQKQSPEAKKTPEPIKDKSSSGAPEIPAASKKPSEGATSAAVKDHAGEAKQIIGQKHVGHPRTAAASTENKQSVAPAKASHTVRHPDAAHQPGSAPTPSTSSSKEEKSNPTGGVEVKGDHKSKSKKKKKSHSSK